MTVQLRKTVSGIGLSVAIIIALVIPAGYFFVGYSDKANLAKFKAELSAARVARYIYTHDVLWQYQRVRLEELIEDLTRSGETVHVRIVDANGKVALDQGFDLGFPTLVRDAPIVVAGTTEGRLEIAESLDRLLVETALLSILGALLGLAVLFVLRVLPLRVLDRTLGELAKANRSIEERNTLLRRQNETLTANEIALQASNRHLDAALNNMTQGLCMFDKDLRLVISNQRYLEMYGLSPEIVKPGCTLQALMQHRKSTGSFFGDPEQYTQDMHNAVSAGDRVEAITEIGGGREVLLVSNPMPDGGWVATHEDITERRQAEARILFMARHDALTNLPNRVLFREELDKVLAGLERGESIGVLCLDLDRFKRVNDTLGHPVGDRVLLGAAQRLQDCVSGETDVVSRLGGDEYVILQRNAEQPQGATALATRVIEALSRPFDIEGSEINIGVSVGISIGPADGIDADLLLKNADLALYRAKAEGRGTFHFFESDMDARMQARHRLELDMRKGLAKGEFELYYQPLMTLASQRISGFEALLRWNHPERGLIAPNDFIPLAEEIGLIVPLGEWVLREACREATKWPHDIRIAVNLSPAQFNRNLEQVVFSALAHSGLAPNRLELEITESVLLAEDKTTLATLHKLREFGVRIAMDDFGTGYSSLAYLRSFPFDKIKIDRSFISDLLTRDDCLAIVRAVSGLGSSLGITITAEGVETQGQFDRLRLEGCTEAQGYLFSPPRPAKELAGLIGHIGHASLRVA